MEQQTCPQIAQLQDQLRAEQARNSSLMLQLEATKVGHEVDKGTLQFQNLKLGHDAITKAEKSDAALTEEVQGNIEKARANEVAARGHEVDLEKIALEREKLRHGAHTDAQTAKKALDEQTQTNIETARANELAGRKHEFDLGQSKRDEERSKREHELAMNPPLQPAPAPKAAAGEPALGSVPVGDVHGPAIEEIKHVVSDLSEKVHGRPDYTPHILEMLGKLANQRKPIGAKRTPDGLRLVFDDAASPEPPAT